MRIRFRSGNHKGAEAPPPASVFERSRLAVDHPFVTRLVRGSERLVSWVPGPAYLSHGGESRSERVIVCS